MNSQLTIPHAQQIQLHQVEEAIRQGKFTRALTLVPPLVEETRQADLLINMAVFIWNRLLEAGAHRHLAQLLRLISHALSPPPNLAKVFFFWSQLGPIQDGPVQEALNDMEIAVNDQLTALHPPPPGTVTIKRIDINSQIDRNRQWLATHQLTFYRSFVESPPKSSPIKMAIKIGGTYYFKQDRQWHHFDTPVMNRNGDPAEMRHAFWTTDLACMAQIINAHNHTAHSFHRKKYDRYVIVTRALMGNIIQLLKLSELDQGDSIFHFLLAENWQNDFIRLMQRGILLPNNLIGAPAHIAEQMVAVINQIEGRLLAIESALTEKLNQRYAPPHYDVFYTRYKQQKTPGRVMFFTTRYSSYVQFGTQSLAQGFKAIGWPALIYKELKNQGQGSYHFHRQKRILKWHPEVLLSLNNFCDPLFRRDMPDIPFVTWIHDPPHKIMGYEEVSRRDTVLVTASRLKKELKTVHPRYKDKDVHVLPPLINPAIFYPLKGIRPKYAVGYVGHLHVIPEVIRFYSPHPHPRTAFEAFVHALLRHMEQLSDAQILELINHDHHAKQLVRAIIAEMGIPIDATRDIRVELEIMRFKVAHFILRSRPIKYLIENGIENIALGGTGWADLAFFKPYALGNVPFGPAYNRLINATQINLNMSPEWSFHYRATEIAGAGGFMMTAWKGPHDYQPITDYFEEDQEVVLFKNNEDLFTKVNHYLAHPREREAIAQKGHERMLAEFSVAQGAQKILDWVY